MNSEELIVNSLVNLSFIVPIYNVEKYLRKCVESLLKQDLDDYEIILVDDGSTDGSGAICDSYVSIDDRCIDYRCDIKVVHQSNAGLSAARNAGIKAAKGEYVMFVDSDDYIEPNVLRGLMRQAERENLDVLRYRLQYVKIVNSEEVIGNRGKVYKREYEVFNPYKSDPFKGNDYSETPTDGVTFLNERMNTQCYAWQFIVRKDLLSNSEQVIGNSDRCLFTEGIYFEDTDWTPRMLARAKRVASTETVVYNYLVREGSITNAVNRSKQKKVLDDKMRLVGELQRQAAELAAQGKDNRWFRRMIADTVISIIGILSVEFYPERKAYLTQLQQMKVYPIQSPLLKARLINFSPRLAVEVLHAKNV